MIIPAFVFTNHYEKPTTFMLIFSIIDDYNIPEWAICLSSFLEKTNIKATVFFTGKVAESYPKCVTVFSKNVDIGSQTYSYVNLAAITDYDAQFEEVAKGKKAVDDAGNIYSRLFRAPYGATNENIYSILSRLDIIADFSYKCQYNKYHKGQFIKFDLRTYNGTEHPVDFFLNLPSQSEPVALIFNNHTSIEQIIRLLSELKLGHIRFVNASELTGLDLTIRGDQLV
ncbi:MAG: polysaccharide deacetylase family protein [Candidatus Bathyarchaeia archaeon]